MQHSLFTMQFFPIFSLDLSVNLTKLLIKILLEIQVSPVVICNLADVQFVQLKWESIFWMYSNPRQTPSEYKWTQTKTKSAQHQKFKCYSKTIHKTGPCGPISKFDSILRPWGHGGHPKPKIDVIAQGSVSDPIICRSVEVHFIKNVLHVKKNSVPMNNNYFNYMYL